MTLQLDLSTAPTMLRGPIAKGVAGKSSVERQGGDHQAGLIRGAAVITRGEALGHGMWIDATMLQQTYEAIKAGKNGIKARFTHPGLSSDGLGTFLGRFKNASLEGDIVRADLHLSQAAHDTPDGDLAEYVMQLAEDDPAAFGNSIVFRHDREAEEEFERENQQEVEETDHRGKPVKRLRFRSPDPDNKNHYWHARLASLRAIDAVDSPAANPSGYFHATDVAHEAESLVAYACGLTSDKPELSRFDVDPDRVSTFVHKFLDRHNLAIVPKGETGMSKDATKPADEKQPEQAADQAAESQTGGAAPDPAAEFAAKHKQYVAEFGAVHGSQWLAEGKSLDECHKLHAAEIEKQRQAELAAKDQQIAQLTKERDELAQRIKQAKLGESESVQFNAAEGGQTQKKTLNGLSDGQARYAAAVRFVTPSKN